MNDLHLVFAHMSVRMNIIIDSVIVFYGTINVQLMAYTQILFNGIVVADVLNNIHIYKLINTFSLYLPWHQHDRNSCFILV